MINETIREPSSPGPWVDGQRCHVCGACYRDHRSVAVEYDWIDAAETVRQANGGWESGGGYRSRGAVLWAMRVGKLTDWYFVHSQCGPDWDGTTFDESDPCGPDWDGTTFDDLAELEADSDDYYLEDWDDFSDPF